MRKQFLTVAVLALSTPAWAGLSGTSIDVGFYHPDDATAYDSVTYTNPTFNVGAGAETVVSIEDVTFLTVDFTDLGLSILFNTALQGPTWNNSSFNGLIFVGSGFTSLASATLLDSTTFGSGGFTQSDITFSGNELKLNWSDVSYRDGQQLDIAFATADDAVPEPATWAFMIMGFGLVGSILRRHRQNEAAATN